jgi:hypothetical protein
MAGAAQELNGGIMKAIKLLAISVVAVALSSSAAFAKVDTGSSVVTPLPKAISLADNVVVTPNQPAPAPAPQPEVQVQPVQVQPVAPVQAPPQRTYVTEDHPHNIVATITVSALLGAVAGALIGGAIYYLDTPRDNPQNIGYWAAGGVLVGTGIGVINVIVDENRADRAAGAQLQKDPVPTYRLSLLRTSF